MKRGILYVVIVRKKKDTNKLPPNFSRFIWILIGTGIIAILVGKFVLGYKIFVSF